MTENEIVEGCIKNDVFAQRQLYASYASRMLGICMRYSSSREDAEDILQDGFIQVFRKIETYQGSGALGGWIRRIMINEALQHYRRSKYLRLTVEHEEVGVDPEDSENILANLAAEELVHLIQQLPDGYRMVFNFYAVEGYTHPEIAKKLNISVGTSKSQFSRARALLRQMIEANEQRNEQAG